MELAVIRDIITEEKLLYVPSNYRFYQMIHHKRYLIWKHLAAFRMAQYWKEVLGDQTTGRARKLYAQVAYRYYLRCRNIYGEKAGVGIVSHCRIGRRLNIWHGNVIISANLGDDCQIHGNNVLGNKGDSQNEIPTLGNDVDLGVGAVVIGGIYIADGCIVGANAVVNKDFEVPGSLIVGIPAKVKG